MFILKLKDKRKNLVAALVIMLFMVGGVLPGTQQFKKEQCSDCSSTGQIRVQQQEAGWFFGRHKKKKVTEVYRVLGITVHRYGKCATYS